MRHYDYDWDLDSNGIKFDPELDIDKLGWRNGDYFRIENRNGRAMLVKIDPLIKFLKDGERKDE
jgi:anaerobic selenocysteine-containing dehydrogenase